MYIAYECIFIFFGYLFFVGRKAVFCWTTNGPVLLYIVSRIRADNIMTRINGKLFFFLLSFFFYFEYAFAVYNIKLTITRIIYIHVLDNFEKKLFA